MVFLLPGIVVTIRGGFAIQIQTQWLESCAYCLILMLSAVFLDRGQVGTHFQVCFSFFEASRKKKMNVTYLDEVSIFPFHGCEPCIAPWLLYNTSKQLHALHIRPKNAQKAHKTFFNLNFCIQICPKYFLIGNWGQIISSFGLFLT